MTEKDLSNIDIALFAPPLSSCRSAAEIPSQRSRRICMFGAFGAGGRSLRTGLGEARKNKFYRAKGFH